MAFLRECAVKTGALLQVWGLPKELAEPFVTVLLWVMAGYVLLLIPVLLWRLIKRKKATVVLAEQVVETLSAVFLMAAIVFLFVVVRNREAIVAGIKASDFWLSNGNWWLDLQQNAAGIITVMFCGALYVCLILVTVRYIFSLVRQEFQANGPVMGLVLSVFDFCAGPFWLGVVLLLYAFLSPYVA